MAHGGTITHSRTGTVTPEQAGDNLSGGSEKPKGYCKGYAVDSKGNEGVALDKLKKELHGSEGGKEREHKPNRQKAKLTD